MALAEFTLPKELSWSEPNPEHSPNSNNDHEIRVKPEASKNGVAPPGRIVCVVKFGGIDTR
jgi:hypothetical protein